MVNMEPSMKESINIKVEFKGGLEMLFDNKLSLDINSKDIEEYLKKQETKTEKLRMLDLINYLSTLIKPNERDLFVDDKRLRAGILVLINDTDWELEGEGEHELEDKESICFISTLHGG
ncbi:Ubiquitin- modifier 1 [Mycoemilia scoparia]|uniref:Ubiquitin-related modifier 1 n=1 Tax=Mycoemilia scoparia TaxID=417184 RepID=A0A9W7ZUN4_9FUNG|nr:Ubiquitin- modifier 1 [Mycoemilia scoparia]